MSVITVYLDGVEVPQPKDFDRYSQKVERDFERRFIRVAYPGTFTFAGAGYAGLREMFLADTCSVARFEAFDTCGGVRYQLISGDIALADCKWNLRTCTVECSVQDDAIGARIDNNFRVPVSPTSSRSKNDTDITPVTAWDVSVFDPQEDLPDYLPDDRKMYDWLDCITHAVQYISDGAVSVISPWYDDLPMLERIALCNGYHLRTHDMSADALLVTYTLEKLWMEVATRYNLWMCVSRDNSGAPVIIIDHEDDMFSTLVAMDILHIDGLVQSVDADRLYSAVVVGDKEGLRNITPTESLPFLLLQTHSEERLHFAGQCNRDLVMDLSGEWISDTNIIERVLVLDTTSTDYDKDIFLVQYSAYDGSAVKGTYLNEGAAPYLYNEQLLNINILNRYTLPSDVGQYTADQDASFRAQHTGPSSQTTQIVLNQPAGMFATNEYPWNAVGGIHFDDDFTPPNHDPLALWDGVNKYTAAFQGFHQFGWGIPWVAIHNTIVGSAPAQVKLILNMQLFDSSDTFIQQQRYWSPASVVSGLKNFSGSLGFVMNPGDYVLYQIVVEVTRIGGGGSTVSIQITPGYYAYTSFIAHGGGQVTDVDPLASRIIKYEFDRLIPTSQWNELLRDPRKAIRISDGAGPFRVCHVLEAERDAVKGSTSFTLIANKRQPL